MDNHIRKIIFLVLPIALAFVFSACSGNENGDTANTTKYLVEGKALKGAIKNASIKIYTLNAQGYREAAIGEGATGSDGSFSVMATGEGGPIALVVASGGTYTDEATGQTITIPPWWEMTAVVAWPSDYTKVNLTPLTLIAAEQTLCRITKQEDPVAAMENAKRSVASVFGLDGININETEPADLTSSSSATMSRGNAEVEYGLVLAALSQVISNEGLPSSQTLDLIKNIAEDLSDGSADNLGPNGGALPNYITATPSYVISGLEGASNDFLRNSRNASGIKGASSPTYTPAQGSFPPTNPGGGTTWGAPTNVTASAGDGQVTVSWSAVTDAVSYNVYYSTVSGTGTGGTLVSVTTSPATITGLTNDVAYYFVVTAVSSTEESSTSSEVSATPTTSTSSFGAPTNVAVAISGDCEVTVSWDAVTDAVSYNVYVSYDEIDYEVWPSTESPITITVSVPDFPIDFWVTAVDVNNVESDPSSIVTATPTGTCGGGGMP